MSHQQHSVLPTSEHLAAARESIVASRLRTALYPALSPRGDVGRDVYVKYENHGPVRSFKWRGGLNRIATLSRVQRDAGVVTASTGNHGQGVAWAAGRFGVSAVVVVPVGTAPVKLAAMRRFGADLREGGTDLAEAARIAARIAEDEGRLYIEDGEDPMLMAGAATAGFEVLEDLPDAGTIVVPVGGGNLIAGVCLAAEAMGSRARIVGVQSSAAPAVELSWRAGEIVEASCRTSAGGLATSFPGALSFEVIRRRVDEMVLVEEDDLRRHVTRLLEEAGQVAEGAGAAPFAALESRGSSWRQDGSVALILSGGNLDTADLLAFVAEHQA